MGVRRNDADLGMSCCFWLEGMDGQLSVRSLLCLLWWFCRSRYPRDRHHFCLLFLPPLVRRERHSSCRFYKGQCRPALAIACLCPGFSTGTMALAGDVGVASLVDTAVCSSARQPP